ncbi:MAG: hypothetical protein RIS70_4481 [Planctomycetota bacterium]|jgi:excisionase family DNA binding protein
MAGKLVELPEAAKILGVSSDELMEMRQRGEIHGYRDGASWKFKQEEIDRVLAERGGGGEPNSSQFDETFDHLMPTGSGDDDSGSEADSISILVSEEALGKSPETTSSTIIGRKKPHDSSPSESDITLGDSKSSIDMAASGSSLLKSDNSDVFSGSELKLDTSGSGTGDIEISSSGDSLELDKSQLLAKADDSALSLEDSDELVLGGSEVGGKGSDISLDPAGSGINLANPADSGLSLSEEPLQLGGSSAGMELPEDDNLPAPSSNLLGGESDLRAEDDFLLTPMDESVSDESSDSGSQVIALEDSEAFDENAATALAPAFEQAADLQPVDMLAAEPADAMGQALTGMGAASPGMMATMNMPSPYAVSQPVEAPYRIWEVLLLVLPLFSLLLSGALMFDVMRNMWAFDQTSGLSTSIMDSVLAMFKLQ